MTQRRQKPNDSVSRQYTAAIFLWYAREGRRSLWQSIPAVLVGGAALVLAAWVNRMSVVDLVGTYKQAAEQAFLKEDLEAADIYFRKLIYLDEADAASKYGLALVAERQDEFERTARLIEQIAPLKKPGFAGAHVWIARKLLQGEGVDADELKSRHKVAETHLLHAVELRPQDAEANAMLGQLYLNSSQFDEAEAHFSKVVDKIPEYRLTLAQVNAILGKRTQAEAHGQAARDFYRKRYEQDEEDMEALLHWGNAEVFLENFTEGVDILAQGLQHSKDERFRKALTSAYVTWFGRTDATDLARRLELLQRALTFGPDSRAALGCLQFFGDKQGPEVREVKRILEDMLARGTAPGMAHFILGTIAIHANAPDLAATHLEQAHLANPNTPVIANNLAWAYARAHPPHFYRALALANIALKLQPGRGEFLDTRGQVLIKMGRYKEAVTDLEAALTSLPDVPSIHATLAVAYEHLGVPDLAAKHKRLAQAEPEDEPEEAGQ